ncbi:hypothetical protein B0H13DRAFT_2312561 [Mycena leptocephala]|nr:hypothetical protein B0H13DRAFT_2312561 [Mycena leptocephala]
MSVATPTVLPRPPLFPMLLVLFRGREMDDLSDEENELQEMNISIRRRGFNTLIPMGQNLTQQDEKDNDDDGDSDSDSDSDSVPWNVPSSVDEDVRETSIHDLDASMASMQDLLEEYSQDEEEEEYSQTGGEDAEDVFGVNFSRSHHPPMLVGVAMDGVGGDDGSGIPGP